MTPSTYTTPKNREGYNIIQPHLTINCYLQHHSDSSDFIALKQFLATAIEEKYSVLHFPGQETSHNDNFKELLKFTNTAGYYNSVTTDGILQNLEQNQEILQYVNLVTLRLDGKKEEHNYIRNNPAAFDQTLGVLEVLKSQKVQFGIIHHLHNEPKNTLKWICDFAKELKAKMVQLVPVDKSGAKTIYHHMELSDELRHKFFVLYHFYKLKHQDDFDLQLDLLHRNIVLQYPQLAYQYVYEDICDSNFYRELIIDEEGFVLPVAYGFPRRLALGNIYEYISLKEMMSRYHAEKLQQLKNIYLKVYQNIVDNPDNLLFNYPQLVLNESRRIEEVDTAHTDNVMHYNYGVC